MGVHTNCTPPTHGLQRPEKVFSDAHTVPQPKYLALRRVGGTLAAEVKAAGTKGRRTTYQVTMSFTLTQKGEPPQLRLWPGVVAVVLQWLVWFVVPIVAPEAVIYAMLGGLVGAVAVLVWWAFFSRVPHFERWGAVVLMIVAVAATPWILDQSIVGGMMGMMFGIYVIPGLSLALVVWAVVSRSLAIGARRLALVGAILVACGFWALVRTQ